MTAKMMKSTAVLPEDIVVDILVQLPVKSLQRFKCVCKSWYNLIQSHDFILMHFTYNSTCTDLNDNIVLIKRALVANSSNGKYSTGLSFHSNDRSLNNLSPICEIPYFDSSFSEVLGPCNGIVCITDYLRIVLCNPATREFRILPSGLYGSLDHRFWYPKGVGFGTDSDSIDCDFKVVRIVRLLQNIGYSAEIYSLRENSWRQLDDVLPYIDYCPCFEIFFNGACHWYASHNKCIILAFRVCEEVFVEIDIPSNYLPMRGQRECLQVLNGSLAFVAYTSNSNSSRSAQQFIDIWVMNDYGVAESWIKLFHIGPTLGIQVPLTIWMDRFLFLENVDGQLELCELDSPNRQKYMISGAYGSMRFLVYKETLLSINKLC